MWLSDIQARIVLRLDAGATLHDVELKIIDPARLPEDQRAALWLFAWAYRDRGPRRAVHTRVSRRPTATALPSRAAVRALPDPS